jgi:hypothetical protein
MNLRQTIVAVCVALMLVGAGGRNHSGDYRGDGNFVPQHREYPALVRSHGFTLELPPFRPTTDQVLEYRLDGLPLMNKELTVAIVTFIPKERIPPGELEKHDFSLPASHKITCELVDTVTDRTIARNSSTINALPMTSIMSLRFAPFVKEVMLVKIETVPSRAKLALRVKYTIGGHPLNRQMFVLVINEPPFL